MELPVLAAVLPGKSHTSHWTGGWESHIECWYNFGENKNLLPQQWIETPTVQPTTWAILVSTSHSDNTSNIRNMSRDCPQLSGHAVCCCATSNCHLLNITWIYVHKQWQSTQLGSQAEKYQHGETTVLGYNTVLLGEWSCRMNFNHMILNTNVPRSFQMLGMDCQMTLHHIPQDHRLQQHCYERFKTHQYWNASDIIQFNTWRLQTWASSSKIFSSFS